MIRGIKRTQKVVTALSLNNDYFVLKVSVLNSDMINLSIGSCLSLPPWLEVLAS